MDHRTVKLTLLFCTNLIAMTLTVWASVELGARTGYRAGHEVVCATLVTFGGLGAAYAALCLLNRSRWSLVLEIVNVLAFVTVIAHWCYAWWINSQLEML